MDDIVDGARCVMLCDVIQWRDSVPGVMRRSVDTGHNIPGTMRVRDKMMDLKARPSPGAESGEACARLRALGRRILINPCDEIHSCPL